MTFSELCNSILDKAVADYHVTDDIDAVASNPFAEGSFEAVVYRKNWIDAVQWHLEDIIRNPEIDPAEALAIKRRIDRSNQERTDIVEEIDDYFLSEFVNVKVLDGALINTESPAWAIDRLSILVLKIFHMREQVSRKDADASHIATCRAKLAILQEQREDLSFAIDTLLDDIAAGRKRMKVYRQMKMYNDPSTNPFLKG